MRRSTVFLMGAMLMFTVGCGQGNTQSSGVTTSTSTSTTTTGLTPKSSGLTAKSDASFTASVNDVISQINLQLPLLVTEGAATKLPTTVVRDGVFGGPVTRSVDIYLLSSANAFSPVRAVTVRVSGAAGSVQTPARLLGGVGVSLYSLSSEALDAFRKDALPRLSAITQTRTTITVGTFYDLTVVVLDQSKLGFVFTPIGVRPPSGVETIGA
jgi:hypothetical protein